MTCFSSLSPLSLPPTSYNRVSGNFLQQNERKAEPINNGLHNMHYCWSTHSIQLPGSQDSCKLGVVFDPEMNFPLLPLLKLLFSLFLWMAVTRHPLFTHLPDPCCFLVGNASILNVLLTLPQLVAPFLYDCYSQISFDPTIMVSCTF